MLAKIKAYGTWLLALATATLAARWRRIFILHLKFLPTRNIPEHFWEQPQTAFFKLFSLSLFFLFFKFLLKNKHSRNTY